MTRYVVLLAFYLALLYMIANLAYAAINPGGWVRSRWTVRRGIHHDSSDGEIRAYSVLMLCGAMVLGWMTFNATVKLLRRGDSVVLIESNYNGRPVLHDRGWYVNENLAYVIHEGQLLRTVDHGVHWTRLELPKGARKSKANMHQIRFGMGNQAWLQTESDLYESTDRGATWRRLLPGARAPVLKPGAGAWLREDERPNGTGTSFWTSIDSGLSWSQCAPGHRNVGTVPLNASFTSPSEGWSIGMGENHPGYSYDVQFTQDGGCTWKTLWRLRRGTSESLGVIYFRDHTEGWVAGTGCVYHSTDGGLSWTRVSVLPGNIVDSVYFSDAQHGWIVVIPFGKLGGLLVTQNGGRTWRAAQLSGSNELDDIPFQWNRGLLAAMLSRAGATPQ